MRILIAPNAFKNSLGADAVARAVAAGLRRSRLDCQCELFPVGDGGDGTAALLTAHLRGSTRSARVHDPLGRQIAASLGLIEGGATAVIEMADASGLRLLRPEELDPLHASSAGTGELIACALDAGVRKIVLGVGGSATVDAGAGLLQALGVRFLDASGRGLDGMPETLVNLASIDVSGIDSRLAGCAITVMCDVDNPLLGSQGAASVFGPQKGASPAAVAALELALTRFCEVASAHTGRGIATLPRGGAAGGVAAGLAALLNAELVRGIDYFLDATGFDAALQSADLVITGEGCLDDQTLLGKAPHGVALRARVRNIPVVALAGQVPLVPGAALQAAFDVMLPIGSGTETIAEAMRHTAGNLERTALQLGNCLAINGMRRAG
jgi:glycerate kinase